MNIKLHHDSELQLFQANIAHMNMELPFYQGYAVSLRARTKT